MQNIGIFPLKKKRKSVPASQLKKKKKRRKERKKGPVGKSDEKDKGETWI